MGIAITKIVPKEEIKIDDLRGKTLAVDGHNMLYQFLTTIRGPDGSPLTDRNGNVTSHLTGLFTRASNLLGKGIRLVFVFDGTVPDLKRKELARRKEAKLDAKARYEDAKQAEDIAGMKKYAGRTSKLTREMVAQAKELLDALGIPWVQAPSEGEAQAAHLVKQGHAWAVVSQDADALLYETPRVVKNLAITGRRKLPGKMAYVNVEPELITHRTVLSDLDLDTSQLRALAVLIGTDYNPGGIKGIGPKKGLKLIKAHGHDFEKAFEEAGWDDHWDVSWKDILAVFETMPTVDIDRLTFGKASPDAVKRLLVEKHDFSEERIESTLKKLVKSQSNTQTGLGEFF